MSVLIPKNGKMAGLFRFADQEGIPLAASLQWCAQRGIKPNLAHYIAEAWLAGWDDQRIFAKLSEAHADSGLRFDCAEILSAWRSHFSNSGCSSMDEWARKVAA